MVTMKHEHEMKIDSLNRDLLTKQQELDNQKHIHDADFKNRRSTKEQIEAQKDEEIK